MIRLSIKNLIILTIVVGSFLSIRKGINLLREKFNDIEIPGKNEEYMGIWAGKSDKGFEWFRLKRNGKFLYKRLAKGTSDTITASGKYEYIEQRSDPNNYPRLIMIKENGDTLLNNRVNYVTSSDGTLDKYDHFILSPNNVFDTLYFTYFRIKP